MQTAELMDRLYGLDAALVSCQRTAIDVRELHAVWEAHRPGLQDLDIAGHAWADRLLRKLAARHGIAGLIERRTTASDHA